LILIAGFDLAVALVALLINRRHIVNRLFFLSHLGLAGWALGLALSREAADVPTVWFWAIFQNIFSEISYVSFLLVTVYFPYQKYVLQNWQKVVIALSAVSLLVIIVVPGWWTSGIVLREHDNIFQYNPFGHWYFAVTFYMFVGLGIFNLFTKFISTGGFTRTQAYYFLVGYGILASVSVIAGVGRSLVTLESGMLWVVPYFAIPINLLALHLVFFYKYTARDRV